MINNARSFGHSLTTNIVLLEVCGSAQAQRDATGAGAEAASVRVQAHIKLRAREIQANLQN